MGTTGENSDSTSEETPLDVKALAVQMLQKGVSSEEAAGQLAGEVDNSIEDSSNDESEDSFDDEGDNKKLGGHPAWQEILSAVPAEYHEALTPKLREWDSGVTKRFQEIHSQYEPLKVFEPIAEDVDADTLSSALGLFQAINTNPEQVYRALGEAYGFAGEQESSDDYEDGDYGQVPPQVAQRLEEQQRAIEALSEYVQTNQMTVEQQQEQVALDNYLEQLQDAYGDFDEDYVLTKMAAGVDGEVAVRQYIEITGLPVGGPSNSPKQTAPPVVTPPQVLGSSGAGSGGIPSTSPDPTKLGRVETKSLVTEILRAAASQGN